MTTSLAYSMTDAVTGVGFGEAWEEREACLADFAQYADEILLSHIQTHCDTPMPWSGHSDRAHRRARQHYRLIGEARNALRQRAQQFGPYAPEHLHITLLEQWTPANLENKTLAELGEMLPTWAVSLHAFGRHDAARAIYVAYAAALTQEKAALTDELVVAVELAGERDADVITHARTLLDSRRENRRPRRPRHARPVPPTASTAPPLR